MQNPSNMPAKNTTRSISILAIIEGSKLAHEI
jgi:hypothetical protein